MGETGGGNGGNGSGRQFTPGNPWRWKPGESGNPAGRRPSIESVRAYNSIPPSITDDMVAVWRSPCDVQPFSGTGLSWGAVVIRSMFVNTIKGKSAATRELFDRIWGKVPLPIKLAPAEEPSDEPRLARAMTDEELARLEALEAQAGETWAQQSELFTEVRRRLDGVVDVEATPVQPERPDPGGGGET